jgi:hypothetical protein
MEVEQAHRDLQDLKRVIKSTVEAFEKRTGMTITDIDITHDQGPDGRLRTIGITPVASILA